MTGCEHAVVGVRELVEQVSLMLLAFVLQPSVSQVRVYSMAGFQVVYPMGASAMGASAGSAPETPPPMVARVVAVSATEGAPMTPAPAIISVPVGSGSMVMGSGSTTVSTGPVPMPAGPTPMPAGPTPVPVGSVPVKAPATVSPGVLSTTGKSGTAPATGPPVKLMPRPAETPDPAFLRPAPKVVPKEPPTKGGRSSVPKQPEGPPPGRSSAPVGEPGRSSAPVGEPGRSSAPVGEPGRSAAPAREPGRSSTTPAAAGGGPRGTVSLGSGAKAAPFQLTQNLMLGGDQNSPVLSQQLLHAMVRLTNAIDTLSGEMRRSREAGTHSPRSITSLPAPPTNTAAQRRRFEEQLEEHQRKERRTSHPNEEEEEYDDGTWWGDSSDHRGRRGDDDNWGDWYDKKDRKGWK